MANNALDVVADFQKQLAQSVLATDTTAQLNNGLDADGVQLANNRVYGFTVDQGSRKEYIIATLTNDDELSGIFSISRQGVATSGFSKNHQVGAAVVISDWAALSYITQVLNGQRDLDAGTPIKYDGNPSMADPLSLATVQFVLDTASGSTVLAFNPLTTDGQATNVTNGDWVYLDNATGLWEKTSASSAASSVGVKIGKARGTVSATAPAGIAGGVFIGGVETVGTYTPGQIYYLANTAGTLGTSAGTNSRRVGVGDADGNLVLLDNLVSDAVATDLATSGNIVKTEGNQTINGVKTFGSIPVLPASNPTTANQATRKTYVDAKAVVFKSDGSNTVISVASTSNVTIANKTFSSLSAGSMMRIRAYGRIINSAGATRTFTFRVQNGNGVLDLDFTAAALTNGSIKNFNLDAVISLLSTSNARLSMKVHACDQSTSTNEFYLQSDTTSSDALTSPSILFQVRSSSATGTQELELFGYSIEALSTVDL